MGEKDNVSEDIVMPFLIEGEVRESESESGASLFGL